MLKKVLLHRAIKKLCVQTRLNTMPQESGGLEFNYVY